MANPNIPFGLRPIKGPGGGEPKVDYYFISSTLAVAIAPGTIMKKLASGFVTPLTATTGAAIVGVSAVYVKASNGYKREIPIYDDPNQRFVIQSALTTTPSAQAVFGATAQITSPEVVNTTNQTSSAALYALGTTSTDSLRIVSYHKRVGHAGTGDAYPHYVVTINPLLHCNGSEAGV